MMIHKNFQFQLKDWPHEKNVTNSPRMEAKIKLPILMLNENVLSLKCECLISYYLYISIISYVLSVIKSQTTETTTILEVWASLRLTADVRATSKEQPKKRNKSKQIDTEKEETKPKKLYVTMKVSGI